MSISAVPITDSLFASTLTGADDTALKSTSWSRITHRFWISGRIAQKKKKKETTKAELVDFITDRTTHRWSSWRHAWPSWRIPRSACPSWVRRWHWLLHHHRLQSPVRYSRRRCRASWHHPPSEKEEEEEEGKITKRRGGKQSLENGTVRGDEPRPWHRWSLLGGGGVWFWRSRIWTEEGNGLIFPSSTPS